MRPFLHVLRKNLLSSSFLLIGLLTSCAEDKDDRPGGSAAGTGIAVSTGGGTSSDSNTSMIADEIQVSAQSTMTFNTGNHMVELPKFVFPRYLDLLGIDPRNQPRLGLTTAAADAAHVFIMDDSINATQATDMILCVIGQTAFDSFPNGRTYKALVDFLDCEDGRATETDPAKRMAQELGDVYVRTTPIEDAEKGVLNVELWIQPVFGAEMSVNIVFTELPSLDPDNYKPYGTFEMFYGEISSEPGASYGHLTATTSNTDLEIEYYSRMHYRSSTNIFGFEVDLSGKVTNIGLQDASGKLRTQHTSLKQENGSMKETLKKAFRAAYADGHFLVSRDNEPAECRVFARDQVYSEVTGYYLVDKATSERVYRDNMKLGFAYGDSLQKKGVASSNHGVFSYSDFEMELGTVVHPIVDGSIDISPAAELVVAQALGMLEEHISSPASLAELRDVLLAGYYFDSNGKADVIRYNGIAFEKVGVKDCSSNCETILDETPSTFTLAEGTSRFTTENNILFHLTVDSASPNPLNIVEIKRISAVERNMDKTLPAFYCFKECIKPGLTIEQVNELDVYQPTRTFSSNKNDLYKYQLAYDSETHQVALHFVSGSENAPTLQRITYPVGATGQYQYGIHSNHLYSEAQLASLQGDEDVASSSGGTVPADHFRYYLYANFRPNRLFSTSRLEFIELDENWMIPYVHSAANDFNEGKRTFDGNPFQFDQKSQMLTFDGEYVWGIEHRQDPRTQEYRTMFGIKPGATVIHDEKTYVLYPYIIQIRPETLPTLAACSDQRNLVLPDAAPMPAKTFLNNWPKYADRPEVAGDYLVKFGQLTSAAKQ